MNRVYLLVYNWGFASRDRLKKWADETPLVLTWRYDLPCCIYLVSEATASELCKDLERAVGSKGRYIITEVTDNRQGRLPADSWYLLRHKRGRPKFKEA